MAFGKKRGKHVKGSSSVAGAAKQNDAQEPKMDEQHEATAESEGQQGSSDVSEASADDRTVAIGGPVEVGDSSECDLSVNSDLSGLDIVGGEPSAQEADPVAPGGYITPGFDEPVKKRRGFKAMGIVIGVIVGVLLAAYIAGIIVFMGRLLPNTTLGAKDVSLMTDAEVKQVINDEIAGYQLEVSYGDFSYHATASELNVSVGLDRAIAAMHEKLNPLMWPVFIFGRSHEVDDCLVVSYDRKTFANEFSEKVAEYNKTATPSTDATIVYSEANKSFVVQPEKLGTQINADAAISVIDKAIPQLQSKVVLTNDQLIQPKVFSTDEKLVESAKTATGLVSADVKLMMGGKQAGEVNGASLSQFIKMDDQYEVTIDETALEEWIASYAQGFNTVGTERTYTRPDGETFTVKGGVYGWTIDADALEGELLAAVKEGKVTSIDVPCETEAATFTAAGERDWGNRYIDVDIAEQHVRFYDENNEIIWEADCISGAPDGSHNTVAGVWTLNSKESPSTLIGYENGKKIYETKVTFWMPFEGNGIGFHDATWQPSFGGTMYRNGYGSHGCVNLSYDDAEELYGIIKIGDVVVVHS